MLENESNNMCDGKSERYSTRNVDHDYLHLKTSSLGFYKPYARGTFCYSMLYCEVIPTVVRDVRYYLSLTENGVLIGDIMMSITIPNANTKHISSLGKID